MKEGEATLLRKMLERKFGPLSDVHHQRVINADAKTLLIWGMRLIDAKTVDEIFA